VSVTFLKLGLWRVGVPSEVWGAMVRIWLSWSLVRWVMLWVGRSQGPPCAIVERRKSKGVSTGGGGGFLVGVVSMVCIVAFA